MLTKTKRWAIFNIWEPKYSTMEVLLAQRKVGERNKVVIKHPRKDGAYDGTYFVAGEVVKSFPLKSNGKIMCYCVPLSQLEKEEE